MSITNEKLQTIKDNVSKVYHSGQMDVIKNANSLKGFESNKAILLDDVSPVTHEMGVRVRGKNLFDKSIPYEDYTADTGGYRSLSIYVGSGFSVTVSLLQKYDIGLGGYFCCVTAGSPQMWLYHNSNTSLCNKSVTLISEDSYISLIMTVEAYNNFKDEIMVEIGTTSTAYTPYISDLTAVKVTRCGKNILEYPYVETTLTRNGITFTDNGDGTITANGTATADTQFRLQDTVVYPDNYNPFKYLIGKIIGVTGSPDGSSKDTYAIQSIQTGNYGNTGFTIVNSNRYRFAIFIKSGITVSNLVFKPMIYLRGITNLDYEFYNRTDYTPTADGTVNGVTSLYPNTTLMTDTDGVLIDCEYYKDVDKAYNKLSAEIALSGGE